MAVLGRLLVSSAERLDLPDFLSLDSYTQGDFKYLLKSLVGDDNPFILKGFDVIDPGNAIGTQNISVRVADSVVYYPGSSAGPFFFGLEEGNPKAQPLIPELRKNATNYVYLTLTTSEAGNDTRAFWDPDAEGGDGGEFTQDVNTETVLSVDINVSVSSFPKNTVPVCKVKVGANFIEEITDARHMMFRLGSGGLNPDPLSRYDWKDSPSSTYDRKEPNITMDNALDPNPFQGGDKNISTMKEWMDAVMTKLSELGGTTYWYEDTTAYNLINIFKDVMSTSIKSKGYWNSSDSTPGKLTWSDDIVIQSISDMSEIMIRSGDKTLSDDQVMYLDRVRGENFNSGSKAVEWFNGVNHVNGTLGAFENLEKGDWVKKSDDSDNLYLRVEEFYASTNKSGGVTSPANALSIKLSGNYSGTSETRQGTYIQGVYSSSEVKVNDRDATNIQDAAGDFYWLAARSDTIMDISDITTTTISVDIENHDGTKARVTSTSHGLSDSQRITISGSTNFDGTYQVSVESVDIFYIYLSGGPYADETGQSAYFATVTTQARTTADGLQLESADHGLDVDQSVIISDTNNYNGDFKVFPTASNKFTIPVTSAISNETSGTSTLVNIYVRTDLGPTLLERGENKTVGETETENIMSFIGMDNDSQTYPIYSISTSYNTLDGQENFNSGMTDNLTERVSKLTSMMADRAQDKTVQFITTGCDVVTNTTNSGAQDITFSSLSGLTPTLNLVIPGSSGGTLDLSGTISLNTDEVAYIDLDRNSTFSLSSVSKASISDLVVHENRYVIASRLSGTSIYLWDATEITADNSRAYKDHRTTTIRQNNNWKIIEGGTWNWNASTNSLSWGSDAYIQVPGLSKERNTLSAGSVTLSSDGDVAYVDINRSTGATDTLTVNTSSISSLSLSNSNRVVVARRVGNDVLVDNFRFIDGQSSTLYELITSAFVSYVGADDINDSTPDYTNALATSSTNSYVVDGESLLKGVKRVDNALGGQQQNENIKLVGGGTWSWNSTSGDLTFSSDAYIQVPGLTKERNTVSAQTITLANDDEIAYVDINRDSGTASILSVSVIDEASFSQSDGRFVIARRVNGEVLVGTSSFALKSGDYLELDGAKAEIDRKFDQLKIKPKTPTNSTRVIIDPSDIIQLNGSTLSLQQKNLLLSFSGAEIDFETGEIFESDGTTPFNGGANDFTPFSIGSNEYFWYSVSVLPDTVNADNTISAQILVIKADSSNSTASAAPKAAFPSTGIKLANIQVQEDGAGGINDISYDNIVSLGVGGSGGGAGSSSTIESLYHDAADELFSTYYETNVFEVDADDKVDANNSTGSYDVATGTFEVSSGQTLISRDVIDQGFLDKTRDLLEAAVAITFNRDGIDSNPTVELTNNGVDYQSVTMNRLDTYNNTYTGYHTFDLSTLTPQVVHEYALGNNDSSLVLDGSTNQQRSQEFDQSQVSVLEALIVEVEKTGTPGGLLKLNLHEDNSGVPGSVINQLLIGIDTLSAGINTITKDIGRNVLPDSGKYHISFETDDEYKANYVSGSHQVAVRADSSTPTIADSQVYDGTTWSAVAGSSIGHKIEGRFLELRMRYTAGDSSLVDGYAVYYNFDAESVQDIKKREQFVFHGTNDNLDTFTLPWEPNAEFVEVHDTIVGQVWSAPEPVSVVGNQIKFPTDFFDGRDTVHLIVKELDGETFNNDPALNNLAQDNYLGSEDSNIDKSSSGRGPKLRAENTILRELGLNDIDELFVRDVSSRDIINILENAAKNYAIAGSMDIWQRGGADGTPVAYPASYAHVSVDRFALQYSGTWSVAPTSERVENAPNKHGLKRSLEAVGTPSATDAKLSHRYRIEAIEALEIQQNGKMSIGLWVWSDNYGTVDLTVNHANGEDAFGTITQFHTESKSFTADGSWQLVKFENIDVPAGGANGIEILLETNAVTTGASSIFRMTGLMINKGSASIPWKRAGFSFGNENQIARRYYSKSYSIDISPGTSTDSGTLEINLASADLQSFSFDLPVIMRSVPSITSYSRVGTIDSVSSASGDQTSVIDRETEERARIVNTGTQDDFIMFHFVAEAEL